MLIALAGDGSLTNHIYLSRHSEVEGPNGGNEAWHDEGNDQTLEHVQEQFARIAHIAGRNHTNFYSCTQETTLLVLMCRSRPPWT